MPKPGSKYWITRAAKDVAADEMEEAKTRLMSKSLSKSRESQAIAKEACAQLDQAIAFITKRRGTGQRSREIDFVPSTLPGGER